MYAVDDLSDAIDVTRNFLTSLRWTSWLKLAVVVFFIGGAGSGFPSGNPAQVGDPSTGDTPPLEEVPTDDVLAIAAVVVLIALVFAVIFGIVGAIMEFVFYESLRSKAVHVRRYASRNLGRALRLFVFEAALFVLFAVLVGGPLAAIFLSVPSIGDVALVGLLAFVGYAMLVGVAFVLISKFTTEFVAPIMLLEERGPVAAWRRFWPALTADWKEYVVYAVLSWIVGIVLSIGVGILSIFVLLAIAVVLGIPAFLLLTAGVPAAVLAIFLVIGILLFLLATAVVQVPVTGYLRYYALLVLGDTNDRFDLIPDQRAAVRSDGPTDDDFGTGGAGRGDAGWDNGSGGDGDWGDGSPGGDSSWDDGSNRGGSSDDGRDRR